VSDVGLGLPPTTWSMDLNMFFNTATERTVFITSTGSTPSDALGKFERPITEEENKTPHTKQKSLLVW